jgi:hypothetical protein
MGIRGSQAIQKRRSLPITDSRATSNDIAALLRMVRRGPKPPSRRAEHALTWRGCMRSENAPGDSMPKLCKFTSPGDGKPVYVNPAQVSAVYTHKGERPDTIIAFRKDFLLGVRESLE